jgi:hypothetical protein
MNWGKQYLVSVNRLQLALVYQVEAQWNAIMGLGLVKH